MNTLYKTAVLITLLISVHILKAQNTSTRNIDIIQDERISALVDKHIAINKKFKQSGYRIQIYFESGNNSKAGAYNARSTFLARYPDTEAYVSFVSPNYKVRVGNFRTRLDAHGFLLRISDQYPNAFIVKDEIDYPPL